MNEEEFRIFEKIIKDPKFEFNNGKIKNTEAIMLMAKNMKSRGIKTVEYNEFSKMYNSSIKDKNFFAALCVVQVLKAWKLLFGEEMRTISMGQFDRLLRKYFHD